MLGHSAVADAPVAGSSQADGVEQQPVTVRASFTTGYEIRATPVPKVIAVTVSPDTATGSQQFSATVAVENGASMAVTWEIDGGGGVSASGYFTEPTRTSQQQVVTVIARSVANPSIFGMATITVPAIGAGVTTRTVSIKLGESGGPAANLNNIMVSLHVATGPHRTGLALYQSETETTDDNAVLTFSFQSDVMQAGDYGLIAVLMPDDRHYLGRVKVL